MWRLLVLGPILLACQGCAGAAIGAGEVVTIATTQHGAVDLVASTLSGRDCSVVHLDRGQPWCSPGPRPPTPPPYCSRSLGVVDCWAEPNQGIIGPTPVADGPALDARQQAEIAKPWLFQVLGF